MPTTRYFDAPAAGPLIENTILTSVPAEYVPIALSALETRKSRVFWQTDDDFSNGLQGVLATQWGLLMDTGAELVEGQNRLYRLLDSALNGTQYAQLGDAISPPIPATPPASTSAGNALRAHVGRLWTLAENAHTGATFSAGAGINGGAELGEELSWLARLNELRGLTDPGIFGIGQKHAQIKDLLNAGRINNDADQTSLGDVINTTAEAIDAGTDVVDIFQNGLDFLKTLATDGGLAGMQLLAQVSQIKLTQRLIKSIDGGNIIPPTDNVLFALRGDNVISTTNNVLEALNRSEAALSNTAKTVTAGEQLQLIYDRLAELQASIISPGDSISLGLRLEQLSDQLAALAYIDGQGNPVAGGALAVINTLLECICEGVNGTPTGAITWPATPAAPCGSDYPNPVLRATVTLSPPSGVDENYQGTVTGWDVLDSDRGVTWALTPDAGALMIVAGGSGGRQLCMVVQAPVGYELPAGGVGLNFNPFLANGTAEAALPVVQYAGDGGQTGTFFTNDVFSGDPAGYDCNVGGASGVVIDYPLRVFIFAGAFG